MFQISQMHCISSEEVILSNAHMSMLTTLDHGFSYLFIPQQSNYGIIVWELWLIDSKSMMDLFVALISIKHNHFLCPEETIIRSKFGPTSREDVYLHSMDI